MEVRLRQFFDLTSLTTLSLYNNNISDVGAMTLAEALRTNTTLTNLDLSFNIIHAKGAKALADALRTNTTLTALDVCNAGTSSPKCFIEV